MLGKRHGSVYVEERSHESPESFVEINEKLITLLIERRKVVGIILEERTLAIGGAQGAPMVMSPRAMVADTDIADGCMVRSCHNWHDQVCRPVGHKNTTAVTHGLLHIVFGRVYAYCISMRDYLPPTDWPEVRCV